MSSGALTYEMMKRAFERCSQTPRGPDVLVMSMGTLRVIQVAGQREARQLLSDMCASTRPMFGDILVWADPEPGKAGRWWMCGGPWPYTAPDPPPVDPAESWAAVELKETPWWRSVV